jgi:small-conductance mechanosensitive channel
VKPTETSTPAAGAFELPPMDASLPGLSAWSGLELVVAGAVVVLAAISVAVVGFEIFWALVVRFDAALGVGARVVVDGLEGRIRRLRWRWVEIETSDGWIIRVPHRRLYRDVRLRSAGHRTALSVRFELPVADDADVAAARARARELVLCSPWSNLSPAPEIEVDDGGGTLRVEAYTFGREGRSRLVADVRSAWRG